jgi:hypothetical protein
MLKARDKKDIVKSSMKTSEGNMKESDTDHSRRENKRLTRGQREEVGSFCGLRASTAIDQ